MTSITSTEISGTGESAQPAAATSSELESSLKTVMDARRGTGAIWIFAYGSLMWTDVLEFEGREKGFVQGWQRSFSLWTRKPDSSKDRAFLTLGLDRGGSVEGILFKIAAERQQEILLRIWQREMTGNAYEPIWIEAIFGARRVWAITFTANRLYRGYAGILQPSVVAKNLLKADDKIVEVREYFEEIVHHLTVLGIKDRNIDAIAQAFAEDVEADPSEQG